MGLFVVFKAMDTHTTHTHTHTRIIIITLAGRRKQTVHYVKLTIQTKITKSSVPMTTDLFSTDTDPYYN